MRGKKPFQESVRKYWGNKTAGETLEEKDYKTILFNDDKNLLRRKIKYKRQLSKAQAPRAGLKEVWVLKIPDRNLFFIQTKIQEVPCYLQTFSSRINNVQCNSNGAHMHCPGHKGNADKTNSTTRIHFFAVYDGYYFSYCLKINQLQKLS